MTAKKKRPDLATLLHTKPSVVTEYLAKHGRKGDKFLAHINRREAAMLKASGGSGTINPKTGIMEFQDEGGFGEPFQDLGTPQVEAINAPPEYYSGGGWTAAEYAPPAPTTPATPESPGVNVGEGGGFPQFQAGGGYSMNPYAGGVQPMTGQPVTVGGAVPGSLAPYAPGAQAPGKELAAQVGTEPAPPATATPKEKQSFVQRNPWALQAGLGLLGAGIGMQQNKAMQREAQAARGQYQAMAAPYQQAGQQLMAQTQAGQLTAPNRQILEAAQARANQMTAGAGGVAQQQANQQLAAITQQLYQGQLQQAYQLMGIGDNIAIGAINAGIQADREARQTNAQFYSTLANMVSRMNF